MSDGPYREPRSRSGRFLPPDPHVREPYRLTPPLALRVGIFGAFALVVFGILFLRLWSLQVLSGTHYLAQAQNNQLRLVRIEAPRGPILDRHGRILVSNVPGTAVQLAIGDVPAGRRPRLLRRLAKVLNVPPTELAREVASSAQDPLSPVTVKTAVGNAQIDYLYEHEAQFPGVRIVDTYLRDYPYGSLGAQALGYVGEISAAQLKRLRSQGYLAGDRIGQSGIEGAYDTYLRGKDGLDQLHVDSLGHPVSPIQPRQEPRAGYGLRLTLDMRVQRAAELALRYGIGLAHADGHWAADGGAIVAMNPRDGAVLAMASAPTFEPSVYVTRDPRKLAPLLDANVAKRDNYPGLNRAIAGAYPPGSTFKPVTALAGMQEHVFSAYDPLQCSPVAYYGLDRQKFTNWDPYVNTPMTLPEALAQSCDTYFDEIGNRFYERGSDGRVRLQQWARRFGYGKDTGLDIGGESSGLLPTPEWRKQHFTSDWDRAWNPGQSIQLAIGQGDLLVTPLQQAVFYSMLANGGNVVTPYVVSDVEQPGNGKGSPDVILRRFAPRPPQPSGVDPAALQAVRDGLYKATHDPTGTSSAVFGNYKVPISGKTGTAEKVVQLAGYPAGHVEDQSWWCGWGPSDNARLVVCALIENGGHGSAAAAPAALKVFEKFFGVPGPQAIRVNVD